MRVRTGTPAVIMLGIIVATLVALGAAWQIWSNRTATVKFAPMTAPGPATAATSMNPATIYQSRISGVVTIDSVYGSEHVGGTGVVTDSDGYIVTASHVVHEYATNTAPSAIYVEFATHDRVQAQLVSIDNISDIAVIKINPQAVTLHPIPLGDSDKLTPGQPIAVIGAPYGNEGSISAGIVSATHRVVGSEINDASSIADAIQFDAAVNPGNSGGPVFDADGNVVGIAQQIKTKSGASAGVAFAIPVNTVKKVVADIKAVGRARYAWLGLRTATVSPQLARQYALPVTQGAIVQDASGPARIAGLSFGVARATYLGQSIMLGDVVTELAGQPVASTEDVARIAARLPVDTPTKLVYYRAGRAHSTTITPVEQH